jgi:predicted transcriptional regulator
MAEVDSSPYRYTMGMKTAVSIPDELFRRADSFAERTGVSRSRVYQEALAEYLARRDPDRITAALNAVIEDVGPELDEWFQAASREALERIEW